MKKSTTVAAMLAFILVAAAGGTAHAAAPTDTGRMIVTATRTPATLDSIGGSTATVITAEDIAASGQTQVSEVLRLVPGLDVASSGGPGTTTLVFLRGADSKNTLILIDGVMYNDPSSPNRGADIGTLNADNIERIEVVRGAMSVLYGSNATAGVINIITKKGTGKPEFYAGAEGGSYNTWKGYAGAIGAVGGFNYSLSGSGTTTDGYSIANADNDRILHNGNTSEDDGYENYTLSGRFGVDITDNFDVNLVLRHSTSDTDLDDYDFIGGYAVDQFDTDPVTWASAPNPNGSKQQHVENDQTTYRLDVHNALFDRMVDSSFYYQGSLLDRKGYSATDTESYDFEGTTSEFGWQGTVNYRNINYLHLGASYFQESMNSGSSNLGTDADITSLWIQDQILCLDGLDVVFGLRWDNHDEFGSATTYRIAPAYTLSGVGTVFKASYGTGFRAPSLFELYSDFGNEELQEETSVGWDLGIEQPLADNTITIGATYFEMTYEDRIDFDLTTYTYSQLPGDTKTSGLEAFLRWKPVDTLGLAVNYTYTDTEDPEGNQLERRPENKIGFTARWRFLKKGLVNLDLRWVDERPASTSSRDVDGNRVETLDSYTLVNLAASYDLLSWLQLYGRVNNLLDEDYEEAWSYATPGLSAYLGLKVTY